MHLWKRYFALAHTAKGFFCGAFNWPTKEWGFTSEREILADLDLSIPAQFDAMGKANNKAP